VARAASAGAGPGPRGAAPHAGIIVDDRYGEDVLPAMTGGHWWVARPVELPGSRPLAFEAGPQLALTLRSWPTEHVAKCLVAYHPDDAPELRQAQLEQLRVLQLACVATDREFLVEVIPPRLMPADERTLARAMQQIYEAGVRPDWWKLPPPASPQAWESVAAVIAAADPHCRGVLLLGLEASEEDLQESFALAAPHPICRGFAVGRSIFAEAAAAWFHDACSDDEVVSVVAARYARLIRLWQQARSGAVATAT
jgi:5-dehydro-2-deoxygluconokinase